MSLSAAITQLEAQVSAFGHGTPQAPAEGSDAWFLLRASVIGLSYLKRLRTLELGDDVPAADRVYASANRVFKEAVDAA